MKLTRLTSFFKTAGGVLAGLVMLFSAEVAVAQQKTITGKVTEITGEPIGGAIVTVEGTGNGTVTDAQGVYSLNADGNATLNFNVLGYVAQKVAVGDRSVVDVALKQDAKAIEDVVVVGYGATKKANLTGAVASVGKEHLQNRAVRSITQALQGTVGNLNITTSNGAPGSKQNLNIRGYTGINIDENGTRSNQMGSPLVVVDGVAGADISAVNMSDVDNISVLKDAASAAIYGSSAPYGVIIITTKKGRSGKPVISYDNNFGFSSAINLPKYVNSYDFATAFNEVSMDSTGTTQFDSATLENIQKHQNGELTEETAKDPSKDLWLSMANAWGNNDWFDLYFKKASFSQQHNLGVSGATNTSNYYMGLGYTTQEGAYNWADDSYSRYNLRANITSNLTDWMSVTVRTAVSRVDVDNPAAYSDGAATGSSDYSYSMFHQLGRTFPTTPLKNPDGEYSEFSNVLFFTQGGREKKQTDNAIVTGEMSIKPMKGWDIIANYTYNGTYRNDSNHTKTIYLRQPSGALTARAGTSPSGLSRDVYKNQLHTINAYTSYEKSLGDHYLKGMIGYNQELVDDFRFWGSNKSLYTDETPSLATSYGTSDKAINDSHTQFAQRGVFGRLNYNYKERYLLEFNGRYDGSSKFADGVRYKFYPGVSAGWVASRENFWSAIEPVVNYFKLRASWASSGDSGFASRYQRYPLMSTKVSTDTNWIFSDGRQSSVSLPAMVNPNLTWVTTNTLDFGFDLNAFRNRLSVTFDWFRRNAKDFADFGKTRPAILGASAPRENSAEIETRGFEIAANWRDKVGEVSYGVGVTLADSKGKVVKYNNPNKLISSQWYDGAMLGEIWGYETVGLFKDQAEIDAAADQSYLYASWNPGDVHYADRNGDGKINMGNNTVDNPGDRKVIGNSTPRYTYGISANVEWKGVDFSMFWQGVGKRDIMFAQDANYFWGFVSSVWQSSYFTEHTDRWTEKNPNGYLPRAYFNTTKNRQAQTRYLQDASYLRLKNLQVGYTLPKTITDKIKFDRVRVFVTGENLLTFTKLMKIVDPEIVNSDAKVYPLQRTWAFGVNITF